MTDDLLNKIRQIMEQDTPIERECEAVYFLVEIRKLLDRENNKNYPLVKFYCDWALHTKKDYITDDMRLIAQNIYSHIVEQAKDSDRYMDSPLIPFMYMRKLQDGIKIFSKEYAFIPKITEEYNWRSFIKTLVKVLVDQPILKPIDEIEEIAFRPAADIAAICMVTLKEPLQGTKEFGVGNFWGF